MRAHPVYIKPLAPYCPSCLRRVDVTTVLLVDNNNRAAHGRFLNVKPDIGVLTSTARTFIQEGVTTEYATQVLGTTLDNGRLYAQLLTKSSRVLYENDASSSLGSVISFSQAAPSLATAVYHHHNEIISDADWSLNDERFAAGPMTFIKNTDYISPNQPETLASSNTYLVFPTKGSKATTEPADSTVTYENAAQRELVMAEHIRIGADPEPLDIAKKLKESFSVSQSSTSSNAAVGAPIKAAAVQPAHNLPTFTIKNEFAPSGFSWDQDFDEATEKQLLEAVVADKRTGKMLFRAGTAAALAAKEPSKQLPSVTYYGFADFTTVVGDTVIVFSPQTAAPAQGGHITSIKGEATLHPGAASDEIAATTRKMNTFAVEHNDQIIATATESVSQQVVTHVMEPVTPYGENVSNEEEPSEETTLVGITEADYDDEEENARLPSATTEFQTDDNEEDTATTIKPIRLPTIEDIEKALRAGMAAVVTSPTPVIQPSETSAVEGQMLTKPSSDDIAKVLASLAAAAAASVTAEVQPAQQTPDLPIVEADTQVLGGVTTIFFEDDDPFLQATVTSTEAKAKSIDVLQKQPEREIVSELPSITTPKQAVTIETSTHSDEEAETETLAAEIDHPITTQSPPPSPPTSPSTTPKLIKEDAVEAVTESEKLAQPMCKDGAISATPTTVFKTFTYLTTFFIPLEETLTTTSVQANEVVTSEVTFNCDYPMDVTTSKEPDTQRTESPQIASPISDDASEVGTGDEATNNDSEISGTTESMEFTTTEDVDHEDDKEMTESNLTEDIELVYKTLYTTYTYLTTFFHESTSSVSSRKEVVTNIVTSTLDISQLRSLDLEPALHTDTTIQPTSVGIGRPTTSFHLPGSDLAGIDSILDNEQEQEAKHLQATPALDDSAPGGVKTYYTTYTYFTTIFVDGETEISSRTEVYTNYVGSTAIEATAVRELGEMQTDIEQSTSDRPVDDSDDAENSILEVLKRPYDNTISRVPARESARLNGTVRPDPEDDETNNVIQPSYSTMIRRAGGSDNSADSDQTITMITDVKSSSSDGDRHVIENINKQWNGLLEDQISSESNTEEIMPSPTLLLQTSYTTFTYFTTMYVGSASSNVLSRLETVTNVVTETLQPTQTISLEDASLPITYFTTFTYWTTLYKEGTVTTTSREETISNVVTPNSLISATMMSDIVDGTDQIVSTAVVPLLHVIQTIAASKSRDVESDAEVTSVDATAKSIDTPNTSSDTSTASLDASTLPSATINASEPTTFYTTYTYFTTSYIGDETVLNSRFETVTNVVEPSIAATGRAINLENTRNALGDANEKPAKPVYTPNLNPSSVYTSAIQQPTTITNPTGIVSINQGKIIDAEGISTIFYTTKAVGSYINNVYGQIIESTSSVHVDEVKQAAQTPTIADLVPGSRVHKTGLVRLIEGTIVANRTTTLYQSKVIGTVIEGRYAQIIESTSSFLIEKTTAPSTLGIAPTATLGPVRATVGINATPAVVEGSMSEADVTTESSSDGEEGDDESGEGYYDDEDEEEDDGTGRKKSRLTFSTRKRTFTPVIRPFASRNRPTFNPKRKNVSPSSATIVSRSDFTPTITATPAIKSESSRGRFSSNRRSSVGPSSGLSSATTGFGASSTRRFSRPRSSSVTGGSQNIPAVQSSRSRQLQSSSNRIQPTASNFFGSSSRRANLFRSSSLPVRASAVPSNTRFRINPTLSSGFPVRGPNSNINTSPRPAESDNINSTDEDDDALTTLFTNDPPTDTTNNDDAAFSSTTENTRRNQNPLLRFRRPPAGRPAGFSPATAAPRAIAQSAPTRRAPSSILQRGRAAASTTTSTTTTAKPKTRTFQRPAFSPSLAANSNRTRSSNGLFPPRGLFRPAAVNQDLDKDDGTDADADNKGDSDIRGANDDLNNDYGDENAGETRDRRENAVQKYFINSRSARNRRQVDYGTRNPSYSSRYRRPSTAASIADEPEVQTNRPSNRATPSGRYTTAARARAAPSAAAAQQPSTNPRIRPTSASSKQGRAQFTLREKDNVAPTSSGGATRSNFRRPATNANSYTSAGRRKPAATTASASSRPKSPRLRSYSGIVTESPYNNNQNSNNRNSNSRSRSNQRGRTTSRSRSRSNSQDQQDYALQPSFDGTITVTHHVPTEITIPVVNGKVTEYKQILTAKVSTEVLGPKQYTTYAGANGANVIALTSEVTGISGNGATEITQYILQETPTTSVIFTPTTIRGRKTSFSHIIPSTVYNVEQVVSTIQPQIAANAPLANILLSQLLLGNLNLPQQQQLNPLLGLQQQQQQQMIAATTPVTEFKVRTTTYVTTVTTAMSTVIPLTFRGKEILTTIVDNSVDVITATEFLTDTIVTTPTQQPQQQGQINSLLLPLLLQQQAQQQAAAQQQQPSAITQHQQLQQNALLLNDPIAAGIFASDPTGTGSLQLDSDDSSGASIKLYQSELDDSRSGASNEEFNEQETFDDVVINKPVLLPRKNLANRKFQRADQDTSVITLYVSGRRPGEFSTVLSTIIGGVGGDSSLQKRAVRPSAGPDDIDLFRAEGSSFVDAYVLQPSGNDVVSIIESSQGSGAVIAYNSDRTESLESHIGDVSRYIELHTIPSAARSELLTTTIHKQRTADRPSEVSFLV